MKSLILLLGALAAPVLAQIPAGSPHPMAVKTGFTVQKDVVYGKGTNGDLVADIYLPQNKRENMPAVLDIHGGGWSHGTRHDMSPATEDMAAAGFVGVSIEYDLSSQGGSVHFPTALDQCWMALQWMRQHAKDYGIDPTKIAVAGSSAGGELAALVALGVGQPSGVQQPAAAVVYNGVLDLSDPGVNQKMVEMYLGGSCEAMKDACKKASPSQAILMGAPPFFVGHGTKDEAVPYAQAEQFIDKLKKASVAVMVFTAPGGPHTYWKDQRWLQPSMDASIMFLKQALKVQ
ncbi:MAG: alpha/beta hydrolase [Edaphobacter sp.]|uniref:alpha/beta hydrolase n=1 Tax=Edaphobacter sp. TaxID=1934404 RepID=UPI0023A15C7F|nr:alpha/beta hydrolase [Edaphobacter sp.]MDE1176567.1 alpha/beta hydrolase [Edaphobacter sp.]